MQVCGHMPVNVFGARRGLQHVYVESCTLGSHFPNDGQHIHLD